MRPVRCKAEAENMKIQSQKFPKQEESRLLVLEMSFRKVYDLLMKNTSTEWKSSELQQLKNYLGLQRQFYTTCNPVASSVHVEVENWSAFWRSLSDFLSEKSFSSCAWESARTVILQVMRRFYRSTTKSPRPIRSC
ncbi:interferon tau-like [Tachysurus ichikawai]